MSSDAPFDSLPLWGLFALTLVMILLADEAGYRLGLWRRKQSTVEKEAPVGTMVGAVLGLLAFLLAFTFGMAGDRFDTRRGLVLDEANAIGTAYLRAGFLPEPHRTTVRGLLQEYVDVRLAAVQEGSLQSSLKRSDELHQRLWSEAVAAAEKDPRSVPIGLFIQALNEVIDLHSKRVVAGLRNRIPTTVWVVLFMVAILAMGTMGYHAGLAATNRSPAVVVVAVTFATVLWLVADLDRPQQGMLRVSQQPLLDLREMMAAPKS